MPDTVQVQFGLALLQILVVNEKSEIIKLKVWERYVSSIRYHFVTQEKAADYFLIKQGGVTEPRSLIS